MTKRPAHRRAADAQHDEEQDGAILGIDTVDGLPPDLRSNTDVLIGTETKSSWGGVHCMKSKSGTDVVVGVKAFEAELKRLSGGTLTIVRVHPQRAP